MARLSGWSIVVLVMLAGCRSAPCEPAPAEWAATDLRSMDEIARIASGSAADAFVRLATLECKAKGLRVARVRPLDADGLLRVATGHPRVVMSHMFASQLGEEIRVELGEPISYGNGLYRPRCLFVATASVVLTLLPARDGSLHSEVVWEWPPFEGARDVHRSEPVSLDGRWDAGPIVLELPDELAFERTKTRRDPSQPPRVLAVVIELVRAPLATPSRDRRDAGAGGVR